MGDHDEGMRIRIEVLGSDHVERSTANATDLDRAFLDWITTNVWGDLWADPTLDRKTRQHGHHRNTRGTRSRRVGSAPACIRRHGSQRRRVGAGAATRRRVRRSPRSKSRLSNCADSATVMTETYTPRSHDDHPPFLYADYRSTVKRAPTHDLIAIVQTLTETTGPGPAWTQLSVEDADLTTNAGTGGEAIGQRIIVTGRVLDEDGAPVPDTLVEVWQANASRALRPPRRPVPGAARPELPRHGPLPHRRRRRVPLPDDPARRRTHGGTTPTPGGRRTSTSRCWARRSPRGWSPRCTSPTTRCSPRPDLQRSRRARRGSADRHLRPRYQPRMGARLALGHRAARRRSDAVRAATREHAPDTVADGRAVLHDAAVG